MKNASRPACTAMLADIAAYLDGELAAAECAAIQAHCAECAGCASLVEDLRATLGLCRGLAEMPLPESVRERARERVRRLLDDAERSSR
ncbi:MAG: zf-HC2 domain-containing protein [Parafilimonas sp.]